MKKVAILQSNYIPWKGYFDLIDQVDEFILFDEMQYTKRDWRNRNKIKTPQGLLWLSVPVEVKGKYFQKISETLVLDQSWREKHFKSIDLNYRKSAHYSEIIEWIKDLYFSDTQEKSLSAINQKFIEEINKFLGIETIIRQSSEFDLDEGKTDRLVSICVQAGATEYISGPAAKDYIEPGLFEEKKIKLSWMNYSGYPEYPQLYPPFEHGVSIFDLILNMGSEAKSYFKREK